MVSKIVSNTLSKTSKLDLETLKSTFLHKIKFHRTMHVRTHTHTHTQVHVKSDEIQLRPVPELTVLYQGLVPGFDNVLQ